MKPSTVLFISILFEISGVAATYPAASASRDDVQAAVNLVVNGDTVTIPAGSSTWTSGVIITNGCSLIGAGSDQVIISDSYTDGHLISVQTKTNQTYRVSGIQFNRGAAPSKLLKGAITVSGASQSVRIDHCVFTNLVCMSVRFTGWVYGVVDHCTNYMVFGVQACHVAHDSYSGLINGDGSWADGSNFGGLQFVVFEDNMFTSITSDGNITLLDAESGGRAVWRFNLSTNGNVSSHGTETSGRQRSVRAYEIYGNTVYHPIGTSRFWFCRGGTGLVFSNVVSGFTSLASLRDFRDFESFSIWGPANGTNGFDTNNVTGVFASGTHDGTDNASILTDTSASWTVDQWRGYTLRHPAISRFSSITANTATTIIYGAAVFVTPLTMEFDIGDTYEIRKVEVAIDQPGRGQGDALEGSNPPATVVWLNQVLDPIYEWENTLDGGNGTVGSQSPRLVSGLDFYNDTPKPGYAPLAYPHPLIAITEGGAADVTGHYRTRKSTISSARRR